MNRMLAVFVAAELVLGPACDPFHAIESIEGAGPSTPVPVTQTLAGVPGEALAPETIPEFAVHEWGTFTSVQSSTGETLEGLHHEEEPLPPFVHSRCKSFDAADCLYAGSKGALHLPEGVTQKLETPVLYFHRKDAAQVIVDVEFPLGLITQWYPSAAEFAPPLVESARNRAMWGVEAIAGGAMTWQVEVNPRLDVSEAPWVPEEDLWAPSRNVDSTPLAVGEEVEGFVFYRGFGRFEMPVRTTVSDGDRIAVTNEGSEAIPAAWLLNVDADFGGIVSFGPIAVGATVEVPRPEADHSLRAFLQAARHAVAAALETTGLQADESRAMVETWTRSWFRSDGLRLLYIVPEPWTDSLLPMAIDPAPDELVRTLVGRIEILTPEVEAATARWLATEAEKKQSWLDGDPSEALAAKAASDLGRFAEPRLRLACASAVAAGGLSQSFCGNLLREVARLP